MAYNGTKLGQDIRFKDPDKDILLSMKIPKIFSITVSKQNIIILPIIKLWLTQKINEALEFEDETLVNLIINIINSSNEKIDPKNIQYQISGFLGDKTYSFMKKFWKLLISVQECYLEDKLRIPNELIPFKIELDKKQAYKKFERYKEYENNYDNINNNNINDNEDKTKIELMKVIDLYNAEEKNKNINKKNYREKSGSKSISYEKRKYRSRSRDKERKKEKEEYKSNSRSSGSRSRKRHKRRRSKSSSGKYRKEKKYYKYDNHDYKKIKERKRKYSRDYSYSSSDHYDYDDYHLKKYKNKKYKEENKHKINKSISSSDSSETFKI